jgi:hypothetical protein
MDDRQSAEEGPAVLLGRAIGVGLKFWDRSYFSPEPRESPNVFTVIKNGRHVVIVVARADAEAVDQDGRLHRRGRRRRLA